MNEEKKANLRGFMYVFVGFIQASKKNKFTTALLTATLAEIFN